MDLPEPEIFGIWLQSRLSRIHVNIFPVEMFTLSGRVPWNLL